MEHQGAVLLVVVAVCLLLWVLGARRLQGWLISAPIAFTAAGLLAAHPPLDLVHLDPRSGTVRTLAELTLALLLFADASRVTLREVGRDAALPARLLGVGLPCTMGLGALVAWLVLPGAGLWVAASLAAIVAPTDAALGSTLIEDNRLPLRLRRLLNVESGLNDGIAAPFVNLFLAGAVSVELAHSMSVLGAAKQLLVGAVVGIAIGAAGGWLLDRADARGWSDTAGRPVVGLALSLLAFGSSVQGGGNGFVAAFVAGMAFSSVTPDRRDSAVVLVGQVGEVASLLVWFVFGACFVVPGVRAAGWGDLGFAVLALTVVRMVPVAVSCLGSGLDAATVAFLGWFGPRGLASVVFSLIAYDSLARSEARQVLAAATVTVAMSVVVHGVTAGPFTSRYARRHPARDVGRDGPAPRSPRTRLVR